jgi:hypothetical protein
MAQCDFFMFPEQKISLKGSQYGSVQTEHTLRKLFPELFPAILLSDLMYSNYEELESMLKYFKIDGD